MDQDYELSKIPENPKKKPKKVPILHDKEGKRVKHPYEGKTA